MMGSQDLFLVRRGGKEMTVHADQLSMREVIEIAVEIARNERLNDRREHAAAIEKTLSVTIQPEHIERQKLAMDEKRSTMPAAAERPLQEEDVEGVKMATFKDAHALSNPYFTQEILRRCASELHAAVTQHDASYPDGHYHAANDRIGRVRAIGDAALWAAGLWPRGKKTIGNDEALALLQSVE